MRSLLATNFTDHGASCQLPATSSGSRKIVKQVNPQGMDTARKLQEDKRMRVTDCSTVAFGVSLELRAYQREREESASECTWGRGTATRLCVGPYAIGTFPFCRLHAAEYESRPN